jgi:hypothetical protein
MEVAVLVGHDPCGTPDRFDPGALLNALAVGWADDPKTLPLLQHLIAVVWPDEPTVPKPSENS